MREENEEIYTTHEAAEILGVSPITVIRWIKKGQLKCLTTLGGHRRIERKDLKALAEQHNLFSRLDPEVAP